MSSIRAVDTEKALRQKPAEMRNAPSAITITRMLVVRLCVVRLRIIYRLGYFSVP